MAGEQERNPLLHNLGIAAVLMLTASAVVVKHIPLQGSRPPSETAAMLRPVSEQDVEARLWQDPIGAVSRHKDQQKSSDAKDPDALAQALAHSPLAVKNRIKDTLEKGTDVIMLGAMIRGGPYFEDSESRRRLRYAVVSALRVTNYVPENAESIGYIDYVPETSSGYSRASFIPFEWFDRNRLRPITASQDQERKVVVLWLEDGPFLTNPRAKLTKLLTSLVPAPDSLPNPRGKLTVKILGPRGTGGLQALLREVDPKGKSYLQRETVGQQPDLEFLSYSATADDAFLLRKSTEAYMGDTAADYLNRQRVKFIQTIGSDKHLAGAILEEMKRRGVDFAAHMSKELNEPTRDRSAASPQDPLKRAEGMADPTKAVACDRYRPMETDQGQSGSSSFKELPDRTIPHLVLIGEADTAYARALPFAFLNLVDRKCADWLVMQRDTVRPHWIHYFSYLRGLDGQIADTPRTKSAVDIGARTSDAKSKKDRADDTVRIERPEGQSQIDYLRRLAEKVKQADQEASQSHGRIRAIGVIGSDVYDKLLILQALKPSLPDAIFFTTDLDTRLLHPADRAWTRNLLIASSFGLELTERLQRDMPPFRDSYQTSIFLATQLAVRNASIEFRPMTDDGKVRNPVSSEMMSRWLAVPRMYELGRDGMFELTFDTTPADLAIERRNCAASNDPECVGIHPPVPPLHATMTKTTGNLAVLGLGAAVVGYVAVRPSLRRQFACLTARFLCAPFLLLPGIRVKVNWKLRRALVSGGRRYPLLFLLLGAIPTALFIWIAIILKDQFARAWNSASAYLAERGLGEPLDVLGGVSIWPTEGLRLVAAGMALYFLFSGWRKLELNRNKIIDDFALSANEAKLAAIWRNGESVWEKINHALYRLIAAFSYDLRDLRNDPRIRAVRLQPDAAVFWLKYLYQGSAGARLLRVATVTIIVWVLAFLVANTFIQLPAVPYRGALAGKIDIWVEGMAVAAVLFLCFSVADAILLCHNFARELRRIDHAWPPETLRKFAQRLKTSPRYLDDWIDLKILEERTKTVAQLVYYPFIVLSLLILARSPLFDNWVNTPTVYFAPGIGLIVIIGCAVLLRRAAERSRSAAIGRITEWLIAAKALGDSGKMRTDQLTILLHEVQGLKRGAFAPYTQQPVIKALMIPLSAMSGTALLDYFVLANV